MCDTDEFIKDELEEADEYIGQLDYGGMFYWACTNNDSDSEEILGKVVQCYEICAEHGMAAAVLNLGAMYYLGTYVPQDYKKAYELYMRALELGETAALCNIGYCWYYGRHQATDYEKALRYFELGAALLNDPNCLYKLGDMYLNGYAVEKNEKFAYAFYLRAKDSFDKNGANRNLEADINFRLGRCALEGIGRKRSPAAAVTLLAGAFSGFAERSSYDKFAEELMHGARGLLERAVEEAAKDAGQEEEDDED